MCFSCIFCLFFACCFCPFSLPLGVGDWLRFVIVAFPELIFFFIINFFGVQKVCSVLIPTIT